MRTKLGLLLMEEADGNVAVQLFEETDRAYEAFRELKGRAGDPPRRATFIKLEWKSGNCAITAMESRNLPLPVQTTYDGYRLGEGPVQVE